MKSIHNKVRSVIAAIVCVFCTLALIPTHNAYASVNSFTRIAGNTRYETMSQIVEQAFPTSSEYAVLAAGSNFPDALAASSLAGAYNAPIILTDSYSLSSEASFEMQRLGVRKVFIIGGQSAISADVEQSIRQIQSSMEIERIAGSTRYDTALQIYNALTSSNTRSQASKVAIIATGNSFADALSISPYAYQTSSPFFLSSPSGLDPDSLQILESGAFNSVIIAGGTAAVPQHVQTNLEALGINVTRLSGGTRYETSKSIGKFVLNNLNSAPQDVVFATGSNFPDALAGSALSGSKKTAMLLVQDSNSPTIDFAAQNISSAQNVYVLGGKNAVNSSTLNAIARAYGLGDQESEPQPPAPQPTPQPNPQVGTHDAGEFCKKADVGKVEYAKNGRLIVCEYRNNNKTPHWHYV